MNLRCFFGHKYEVTARHGIQTYEKESSKMPWKSETTFLLKCKKCGNLKSQTLNGLFIKEIDDDDGGGNDPKTPMLSPDDYYESITK